MWVVSISKLFLHSTKMPICVGIKTTGERCTHGAHMPGELGRCGIHYNQLVRSGAPLAIAVRDLDNIRKYSKTVHHHENVRTAIRPRAPNYPNLVWTRDVLMTQEEMRLYRLQEYLVHDVHRRINIRIRIWRNARFLELDHQFRNSPPLTMVNLTEMIQEFRDQLANWTILAIGAVRVEGRHPEIFGQPGPRQPPPPVDPVALEAERVLRETERLRRLAARAQHLAAHLAHPAAAAAPAALPRGELEAFAIDRQNVHTTRTVQMTKEVVARVLKIAVPEEYRWNPRIVSKTPGEIITECRLSPNSVAQFVTRYLQNENIYEMGVGIYGKVLDGVWQYVRNSEHKDELCKILRQELQDNIGMCLQGNLTRLCNVLAGYMDGIGPQESPAERLGREMPKLMEIEDIEARMNTARIVLRDVGLPENEWAPWLEALE